MDPLINLIRKEYEVRKTKRQKDRFISLMQEHFPELTIQQGGLQNSRNLIIGNVDTAKVILTAHYDTCAALLIPNFITPKNPVLSLLYSFLLIIPLLLIAGIVNYAVTMLTNSFWLAYWLCLAAMFLLLYLMMAGPANPHTANDNTSGVSVLCNIYRNLAPEEKANTAIVFFDHEEIGLLGSALFRKTYKTQMQHKLLINFDCVSDGDYILLAVSKAARKQLSDTISECYIDSENKYFIIEKAEKVYYPSDQLGFPQTIAIAALKKNKMLGYYMDRIHTPRDTIFDEENIKILTDCTIKLVQNV